MSNDLFSALTKNKELLSEASLAKIAGNLTDKDFLAAGLPTNGLYFISDTETSGLNFKQDDLITEIAIIAFDNRLNEIPDTMHHSAIKKAENLPDDKNPSKIIEQIKESLRPLVKGEDKINRLVMGVFKDLRKAPAFTAKDAFKNVFKKRMSIFLQKNHPEKMEELAANPRIRDLYFQLRKLITAAELRNVFKMTKFGKLTEPAEVQNEQEMAEGYVKFVNETISKHSSSLPIVVAHNYPFDALMMKQAVSRKQAQLTKVNSEFQKAGIEYPFKKFIDTAQFARKIINKLLLATFIYYSKMYVITKDERYKKMALKITPNMNNRMGTLAQYFKIPNLSWHTAANDVRATAQILKYLIALNSRITSYIKDPSINKEMLKNVQDEIDKADGGEASGAKKPDFFDALRGDLYRKMHEQLYAEFSGTEIKKKPSNYESKDEKIEYLTMLEKEFPGLGDISSFLKRAPKKFNNASDTQIKPFAPEGEETKNSLI
jgi:DNA polymerase III epsilon subunit-like protein